MNIFVLDEHPQQAAQWHCDKHVVKMILESAQLMCSVYHLNDIEAPYKLTHKNHPCAIWARESLGNFKWLLRHSKALTEEYYERYNKIHKSETVIRWCEENINKLKFPREHMTPFALAMPDEYKRATPVQSYREYYKEGKKHLHSWKRNHPHWIDKYMDKETSEMLWSADPNCEHVYDPYNYSGIKCKKCNGWYCL